MQLIDDLVIFGIVLESATGVDCACDAEPVEFPHEVPRGIGLILQRKFRPLREGRIENHGVGACDQNTGRITAVVHFDLPAGGAGVFEV
jgi:hypothetical protein